MKHLALLFLLLAAASAAVPVLAPGDTPSAATSPAASLPTFPAAPPGATITADGWFTPPTEAKRPKLPEKIERAFVIPIREEITGKTFDALQRKVERCRKGGAQLIVLDMDTWGGELIPALDIARMIKVDLADVYTVCYVRTRAVSAGALIGMSCNEIVMTPTGTFGDCAPISSAGQIEGIEREKIETVIRKEFRESADRNGYSAALSQGMVTATLEIWLIRNKKTRQLQYVLSDEWRGQVEVPPGVATAPSSATAEWEVVKVAKPAGRLLTMKTSEAIGYGFVKTVVDPSLDDPYGALMKHFNVTEPPTVLSDTWSESLVEFLTSSTVTGILFFLGIFFAYMELNAPGHFVPGIIAAVCFAILFGSRYLVGLSDWWQIALFIVGIILIVVELVTFHTFGTLLVVGILCCLVSVLAILAPHMPGTVPIPQTAMDWSIFTNSVLAILIGFIGAFVAAMLFARFLPRLPVAGKLVLPPLSVPSEPPVSDHATFKDIQIGEIGVAETLCRPVGKVRFGERLLNATSTGDILQPGDRVKVLRRDENRIVVEKA